MRIAAQDRINGWQMASWLSESGSLQIQYHSCLTTSGRGVYALIRLQTSKMKNLRIDGSKRVINEFTLDVEKLACEGTGSVFIEAFTGVNHQ